VMLSSGSVLAALALCVSVTSAWANCQRNEYGVYEDVACASEAFAEADKRLNEVYKQLLTTLDADTKKKLKAAQRAWLAYRDANARFVYAVEGDGSAGRMVAANDLEQQTQARIKELKGWLPNQ